MYSIAEQVLHCLSMNKISSDDILNGVVSRTISRKLNEIESMRQKYKLMDKDILNDFEFVVKCLSFSEQDRLNEMSNLKRARVFIDRKEALKKFSGSTNEEVKLNSEYAGKVVNVTDFGAFVELRNCCDLKSSKVVGLAPMSLNGPGLIQSLQIGQNVQVKVTKIDVVKGHFTLKIIE